MIPAGVTPNDPSVVFLYYLGVTLKDQTKDKKSIRIITEQLLLLFL